MKKITGNKVYERKTKAVLIGETVATDSFIHASHHSESVFKTSSGPGLSTVGVARLEGQFRTLAWPPFWLYHPPIMLAGGKLRPHSDLSVLICKKIRWYSVVCII